MGSYFSKNTTNTEITENKFTNFYEVIDYIATYYILTMDFQSLSKLSEKEYCDNLIVLTSDIINRYFTDLEVTYLEQRVKKGLEVNELTKDNIIFLNKEQLENLDVKNDAQKSIKKKRVCNGIAKYYIKIAHLYAAIMMTINPVYIYKDQTGLTVKKSLLQKNEIPKNVNRTIVKTNICDNRIRALKRSNDIVDNSNNNSNNNSKETIMNPKICDININSDKSIKSLSDEPGIQELMNLYLDDKYDYSNGTFTGMSSETQKQFEKDLKTFYQIFTGKEVMPPEIKKFSDIKLKDASAMNKKCVGDKEEFKQKYNINKEDTLFIAYATNIKEMINKASSKQGELLHIINDIFTFVIDPHTKKKKIRINPKLTDELLQKAVEKSRKLIIELYINCETDYIKGINLYEAIVEKKILETTQNQVTNLKKEKKTIIEETKNYETNDNKNSIIFKGVNPELNNQNNQNNPNNPNNPNSIILKGVNAELNNNQNNPNNQNNQNNQNNPNNQNSIIIKPELNNQNNSLQIKEQLA
jgi:hypothetical protein